MDDQDLHSLLEQLHAEIERNEPLDEEERELLIHLSGDIRELLARSEGKETQVDQSMIERLEESIDRYEVAYPDLTMLLGKLLAILSNAGI